jgi:hypothetical protein
MTGVSSGWVVSMSFRFFFGGIFVSSYFELQFVWLVLNHG